MNSGGFSGTGDGGAATLPVPKAVDAASGGDTAVDASCGAAAEDAAAGAGSGGGSPPERQVLVGARSGRTC